MAAPFLYDLTELQRHANRLFGFKFKVVTGYESTPKIHLAKIGRAHV